MFNLISLLIGGFALVLGIVGFLPLLGWLNWLVIPVAVVGTAFGLISSGRAGRNLNLLVLIVAFIRLVLGGGIL